MTLKEYISKLDHKWRIGISIALTAVAAAVFIVCDFRHTPVRLPVFDMTDVARTASPLWSRPGKYWVTYRDTPNIYEDGKNEVKGIVLHHTAYEGTAERVVADLCNPRNPVSCHVVIDKDGTRYVLAPPEAVTWHAGYSLWKGRYRANLFMIGIEFQGNTLVEPLTDEQIESALEYMASIIRDYDIQPDDIVTHEMIREAYRKANPKNQKAWPKVDITPQQYRRVLHALDTAGLIPYIPTVFDPENELLRAD